MRSWLIHSLCHKKLSSTPQFFFHYNYVLNVSVRFTISIVVCAWIHILDYLCVCSYGRKTLCACGCVRACVWGLLFMYNIKLYVNTLPHTQPLLIWKWKITLQNSLNLFGINSWFKGSLAKLLLQQLQARISAIIC